MEDSLNFLLIKKAILTNSKAQHRQPDQQNNLEFIGTIKKNQPYLAVT